MAKIRKLTIQGIRSFGENEDDKQSIHFHSPLTLILGNNGCGKTTIIECLKFATCGDYPKGRDKTFVRNPNLTKDSQVSGIVVLDFINVKGKEFSVSRTLLCTKKDQKLNSEAFDQIISEIRDDRNVIRQSMIVKKCNEEMGLHLGVLEPMLKNVIFCDQLKSDWPLSEGQSLKKMFDDIFDFTKHDKCIEMINKIVQKKEKVSSELEIKKNFLLKTKEDAEAEVRKSDETKKKLLQSVDMVQTLNLELNSISKQLHDFNSEKAQEEELQNDSEIKKSQLKDIIKEKDGLKISEPCLESKEQLDRDILIFSNQTGKNESLSDLDKKLHFAEKEEQRAKHSVGVEEGRHNTKKEEYEKLSVKLDSLAAELSIAQSDLSSGEIDRKLQKKQKELNELETDLKETISRHNSEKDNLNTKERDAQIRKGKIEQEIDMEKKQIFKFDTQMINLKYELREVPTDAQLSTLRKEFEIVDFNWKEATNVKNKNSEMKSLEAERNRLKTRLDEVNAEVKLKKEIKGFKEELSNMKSKRKELRSNNDNALKCLLQQVPERDYENTINQHLKTLETTVNGIQSELKKYEKVRSNLKNDKKNLEDKLEENENILKEIKDKISKECADKEVIDVLEKIRRERRELEEQKEQLQSSKPVFNNYISKLQQEDTCCPLCETKITSDSKAQSLISKLKSQIQELPDNLEKIKIQLTLLDQKYDKVQPLEPKHKEAIMIEKDKIPSLRTKLQPIKSQIEIIESKIKTQDSYLKKAQDEKKIAESLLKKMRSLDELDGDAQRLRDKILKLSTGGSTRSMEDAITEQKKIQLAEEEYERKQSDLNSRCDEFVNLQETHNKLTSKIKLIEEYIQTDQLRKDAKAKIVAKEWELNQEENCLENLRREKEVLEKENRKEDEKKTEGVDAMKRRVNDIQTLLKVVQEKEAAEQDVADTLSNLEVLKGNAAVAESRKQSIKDKIATQEVKLPELKKKLRFRELENKMAECSSELKYLITQIDSTKLNTLKEKIKELTARKKEIENEISTENGRQGVWKQTLEESRSKINLEVAEKNYNDCLSEMKTLKDVCADLKNFNKGIENVMMNLHTEKMRSVNAFIRELWDDVYQGKDIHSIKILAEQGEGSAKKRSYNYRVVMKKDDVEMNMSSQCSAGQRMLACLVVRIALAKTFSTNCGILALDEPTTNLDEENSNSLCQALSKIVESRKANFQLIVISHNKEFVETLARETNLQEYYVLKQNSMEKSVICTDKMDPKRW